MDCEEFGILASADFCPLPAVWRHFEKKDRYCLRKQFVVRLLPRFKILRETFWVFQGEPFIRSSKQRFSGKRERYPFRPMAPRGVSVLIVLFQQKAMPQVEVRKKRSCNTCVQNYLRSTWVVMVPSGSKYRFDTVAVARSTVSSKIPNRFVLIRSVVHSAMGNS